MAALVPAAFLMVQVYRLDRIEKEPPGLLLKLALFGALSGLAAGAIEGALTRVLDVTLGGSTLRLVLENFLAVALVEEACKRWVVLKFAWNHPAFDYRFDAVVYCVFSALGFAALENIDSRLIKAYQKVGLVKYDAFKEIGGKLSFVLVLLTADNDGFLINSMKQIICTQI